MDGRADRRELIMESTASSRLVFVETSDLSISRAAASRGWRYFDGSGARITDRAEIDRLNQIALPPAYTDARYCPDACGHIQAIGIDARGRRQYRYHPDFRAGKDAEKFGLCLAFGEALPRLRKQLQRDLARPPAQREAVLASVVRILDAAFLRVGNESYARENKSFGLTTLRNRHVRLKRGALHLEFRGKGGIMRSLRLNDRSLVRIVKHCQDLPGQKLFQFRDEDGAVHAVSSNDVNAYLREAMEADFTAKHFRTWHASVIAFAALREGMPLKAMLDRVAEALGNTPAIARKAYVHPLLLELATQGAMPKETLPRATRWQSREERGFIRLLQQAATTRKRWSATARSRQRSSFPRDWACRSLGSGVTGQRSRCSRIHRTRSLRKCSRGCCRAWS